MSGYLNRNKLIGYAVELRIYGVYQDERDQEDITSEFEYDIDCWRNYDGELSEDEAEQILKGIRCVDWTDISDGGPYDDMGMSVDKERVLEGDISKNLFVAGYKPGEEPFYFKYDYLIAEIKAIRH